MLPKDRDKSIKECRVKERYNIRYRYAMHG